MPFIHLCFHTSIGSQLCQISDLLAHRSRDVKVRVSYLWLMAYSGLCMANMCPNQLIANQVAGMNLALVAIPDDHY